MIDPIEMEAMDKVEVNEEVKEIDQSAVYLYNKSTNPDPEYADEGASGMDVRADITNINSEFEFKCSVSPDFVRIYPGGRVLIPTGLHVAIPLGLEIQVRPRSGLALKHGITVLNTPGTIDSSYRGEVGVILVNLSNEAFDVKQGDRIAQLVLVPYAKILKFAKVNSLEELPPSERMYGGFGHTGIS